MYIISKFHDYYDNVFQNNSSDKPIYIRNTSSLEIPTRVASKYPGTLRDHAQYFESATILFCGKAYFLHSIDGIWTDNLPKLVNELEKKILSTPKKKWLDSYTSYLKAIEVFKKGKSIFNFNLKSWNRWRNRVGWEPKDIGNDLFLEHNSPIMIIRGKKLIINPSLKEYNFYKFADPYTAYQDIDQFIGNVLTNVEEEGYTGGDLISRDRHGFDEWSFKNTPPGEKKQRRKRNKEAKRESKGKN